MPVSLALLLIGCASDNTGGFSAGDVALAVNLPSVCEAFLQPVPVPPVTRRTDARVAYVRTADALDTANGRIVGGRSCFRDQRIAYKAKGKPK